MKGCQMKKIILSAFLFSASASVFADVPAVNLLVVGNIAAPTCTVNGESTDLELTYDFGSISPGSFPASGNYDLTPISKKIEVVCDADTNLAFTVTDNRAGTELSASNQFLGLGTWGSTNVGYYTITMKNAQWQASSDTGPTNAGVRVGSAAGVASSVLNKTLKTGWTSGIGGTNLALASIFTANLDVKPTLNNALKSSDGTADLDGNATLAFTFGM